MIAAAGRGDVRGHKGATVVRHRAAVAFDGIADSQVAPLHRWIIGIRNPRQSDAVAEDFLADGYRHRSLAAECHWRDSALDEVPRVFLESHGDRAEGHRQGPEDVRETKSHPIAPKVGLDN